MQVVSIISDFGDKDTYLAEFKASLLSNCNEIIILDGNHNVDYHDIIFAAYNVKSLLNYLPKQSIIIVAVNNYYASKPKYICFQKDDRYFIGPDNGIFSLVFESIDNIFQIDLENNEDKSSLAHYTKVASIISKGLGIENVGIPLIEIETKIAFRPVVTSNTIRGTIIHVDHYENVITNVSKELIDKVIGNKKFAIYYKPNEPINKISKHYGEVQIGDVLCHFNNSGYLEIAINMGKASTMLHLYKNETIQIDFY